MRAVSYSGFFLKREEFSRVETSSVEEMHGQPLSWMTMTTIVVVMCSRGSMYLYKLARTLARMVGLT